MSFDKPNGMPTLPFGWTWKTFDQVCDRISVGHVGETNSFFCGKEGVPFLRSQNVRPGRLDVNDIRYVTKDFHAKSKKSQLTAGDILIVRVGQNRGDCAVVPAGLGELNCANIVLAKPNRKYSNYIGYFFNSLLGREALLSLSSGSAQLVLNTKAIAKVIVPVPPEDVALSIGLFLKTIDDRIALLRETNATLETIVQVMFKSWFVDFDPVRAKRDGRVPEGMDEATAALFPDCFDQSELGQVPMGWRVSPIGDVVDYVGGGTPSTSVLEYWEPGEFAWTTPKDLSGQLAPVLLQTERLLSAKGVAKISSGLLPSGTLLLSSRAPIGYLAIAQIPVAVNQGYIAMLPSSQLPPLYLLFWCRQNMEIIESRANGSTFMEISKKAFRPIPSLVPSEPVLAAFIAVAGRLFDRLVANEKQTRTLTRLRDTLLPRLISGQLSLHQAADLMGQAA